MVLPDLAVLRLVVLFISGGVARPCRLTYSCFVYIRWCCQTLPSYVKLFCLYQAVLPDLAVFRIVVLFISGGVARPCCVTYSCV